MKIPCAWALALQVVLSCSAQEVRFGGPFAGLVFDPPSRALRPVFGLPGAARLHSPVLTEVDWASVAPDGKTAIIQQRDGIRLLAFTTLQEPVEVSLHGAAPINTPLLSAWAADSSAVVLFSAGSCALQWIHIDRQDATADPIVPITGIEGTVTALAAHRPSGLIVLAVAQQGIYRITPATPAPFFLLPTTDPSAITLAPDGGTLWVADRTQAQLLQLSLNADNQPAAVTLSADPDKLADVSALALSSDQKSLYITTRLSKLLHRLDRSTTQLTEGLALDAPATMLLPFGRPSVFLLAPRKGLGRHCRSNRLLHS
jgi:hypothetical protein